MKITELSDASGPKIFAVVFDPDDDVTHGLETAASELELAGGSFTGIGALSSVELGFFDRQKKDYRSISVNEQVEVLTLTGNIAAHGDKVKVHAHVVVGKADGSAMGGHLLGGTVWPTLELVITEPSSALKRRFNDDIQLPLIDLGISGLKSRAVDL